MKIEQYDPEIRAIVEKVYEQKSEMDEGVLKTLPRLLAIAEEKDDYALQGFAHFHIADAFYAFEKEYDLFRKHLAKAIYFFGMADEKEMLARSYNLVAIEALNNRCYDVSYQYLMNADKTSEGLDDNYLHSIINNNIGQLFVRLRSYEKAIKYVHLSTEQQLRCPKDDFYYDQNLINGYFAEGSLYALMNDLENAKKAYAEIKALEEDADMSAITSVFIPVMQLKLMIAVLEGDESVIEERSRELIEKLKEAHRVFDYVVDLEDLTYFLLERDRLDTVKEIIDIVKKTIEDSNIVQMRKIVSSMEIAYYEKTGDQKKLAECLREQYYLALQQQEEQNTIYQYSIDLIDIMEKQRKEQEKMRAENEALHLQVNTDPLTNIPNRLMLDHTMPERFEKAKTDGSNFGVSLMDINKFKEYNDTYGHLAGDICLQKIAKAIQRVSDRAGVFCARYGGDEFIMLYEEKSDEEIRSIAAELNEEIRALGIVHEAIGDDGLVSLSQGICNCTPEEDHRQEDFLNEADNALYAVKKNLDRLGRDELIRLVRI